MASAFEAIAQSLLSDSFAMADAVLPESVLVALRQEALDDLEAGDFQKARIGKGIEKQRVSEIRGDYIQWLDRPRATEAQLRYWEFVDALRAYLHSFFRIHLERTELHFACYPAGAFYQRHLDQFEQHSNRVFSIVLYLNEGWKEDDGGKLRVYREGDDPLDIAPLMGRLVIFRSDAIEHEVLVAHQPRLSITGWMRRDAFLL